MKSEELKDTHIIYKKRKRELITKPLPFESAVAAVNSFDSVAYLLASYYYYLEPVAVVVDWAFDYYYYWGPAAVAVAVERHLIVVISIAAVVVIITLVVVAVVVEVVVDLVGYCSIVVVELVVHWHHPDYYQCYSDVVGYRKKERENGI